MGRTIRCEAIRLRELVDAVLLDADELLSEERLELAEILEEAALTLHRHPS